MGTTVAVASRLPSASGYAFGSESGVWGDLLTLACRTDDLVGEIEKLIESEPLAIPDPDASVAERVAEVLKHIVGRFAGLAPRARVRARAKRVSWNIYIPVYV